MIYAPGGRNAEVLSARLARGGVPCRVCPSEEAFLAGLRNGVDVLLLTQRAWTSEVAAAVSEFSARQPPWSSPPVLFLTSGEAPEAPGTFLLRTPVPSQTLSAAVKLALHARERQLKVASLVSELQAKTVDLKKEVTTKDAFLEASEQRFEKAFRASPAPTLLLDEASGRVLDANPSFQSLAEYDAAALIGATLEDLAILADRWPWKELGALRGGRLEVRLRARSGAVRHCLLNAEPISADGENCLLMTFVDITERKQNEAHLLRAVEDVMRDASWFSRAVVERVSQLKGKRLEQESVPELTPREEQVLALIGEGLANKDIAQKLALSPNTVRNYIKNLYGKIGVGSRAQAIIWARERGVAFAPQQTP